MSKTEIRALRKDEIECRVQQVTEQGVILLLYKDARCDMAILDETFTPMGWERRHALINNKEFCTVSIKDSDGNWVSKQDCGTESNTEKAKGESSDAFKRACVNWGIGRELYTKIFIFIKVPTIKNDKGKFELADKFMKFYVTDIETDNMAKKILKITIESNKGGYKFSWDNERPPVYDDEPVGNIYDAIAEFVCFDCGDTISVTSFTGKDGRTFSAYEMIDYRKSQSPDGFARCSKCLKAQAQG